MLWKNETLDAYCLPFMGADKSVVQRSQYYDAVANKAQPVGAYFYIYFLKLFCFR